MPKAVSPRTKKLPFQGRLKKSHAHVKIHSFGGFSFFVEIDALLAKNSVSGFGFETDGPGEFAALLSNGCALFVGLSHDETEQLTLDVFSSKLNVSPHEKRFALYAWTAIQDVIARLPFDDPLSRAIGKISKLHEEFPLGEMGMDHED